MSTSAQYLLHHIHIVCSDVETSERWFLDGVGAELVDRRESRGTPTTELRLGDTRVLLRAAREGESLAADGERRFGTDHVGLQVENVDATVERLRARGVEIAREPQNSPSNRVAFIKGPDNVLIELVQAR
jgi:catechol 2,3-dioxygenase-like lactoylglutathione lyase family enzyme